MVTFEPLFLARPYQNPFSEGKMPFLAKISDGFARMALIFARHF
jgi:hypothetical protein